MRFSQIITEKSKPNDPKLWSRAKAEAKKKYDVYPSAYANSYASKKYKEWGGTWRTVSEEIVSEITRPEKRGNIVQILQSKGYTRLGDGAFATVFARKSRPNEILKIVDNHDEAYFDFMLLAKSMAGNPHFPKFIGEPIEVTPNYSVVKMEKLEPVTVQSGFAMLHDIRVFLQDYETTYSMHNYLKAFPKFKEALLALRGFIEENPQYDWDLHLGNMMFRRNTLVFTDPIFNPDNMGTVLKEITRPPMMKDADQKLRDAGYERIGTGMYGAVYQKNEDQVVKTFTSMDHGYLAFIKMAKSSNNNPHFPKFYGNPIKITNDYYAIKQENLVQARRDYSVLRWYIRMTAIGEKPTELGSDLSELFEIHPKLQEACDMIATTIATNRVLYQEDVHGGNIMMRGGVPVFVDPISTTLANSDLKRLPRSSQWDTRVREKPVKWDTELDDIYNQLNEDLRDWHKEQWVDISRKVDGKHPPCGAQADNTRRKKDSSAAYPKCVKKSKAQSMTKKEKESASRRKRTAQNKSGSKQTYVSTEPKK